MTARRNGQKQARVRLEADDRKSQLLGIGAGFFNSRPYDEVSIDDIAREAGISKGLLYHYFPTKKDFYAATVEQGARELLDRTRAAGAPTPMDRLKAGLDGYFGYVQANGRAYAALLRSGLGSDAGVREIVEKTRDKFIKRLLADVGVERPPPRLRAALRGWLGYVEAVALDHVDHEDLDPAVLRDLATEVLMTSVKAAMGTTA